MWLDECDHWYCFSYLLCHQEAQNTAPLSTLLEVVNTLRSFGNRFFRQGRFDSAKDRYKQVGRSFSLFVFSGFVITCGKMSVCCVSSIPRLWCCLETGKCRATLRSRASGQLNFLSSSTSASLPSAWTVRTKHWNMARKPLRSTQATLRLSSAVDRSDSASVCMIR